MGVRDRLLDAADRLFYQEGVRAIGIDRVLSEADAAKASLYQHFGSKDQLVASCSERKTKDARASIEPSCWTGCAPTPRSPSESSRSC